MDAPTSIVSVLWSSAGINRTGEVEMVARGRDSDADLAAGNSSQSRTRFLSAARRVADSMADKNVCSDSFLRPTFTIDQIRTFLAVAAREHVTHAARVLRLSQPA